MFMRFTLDSGSHTMKFSGACPQNPPYPGSAFLVTIGMTNGREITFNRLDILKSAKHLAEVIEKDKDLLPYRYSTEERVMGRDDLLVKGTGTATGFQIDGKLYSVTSGAGECYLEEMIPQPNGTWKIGQRIDVRDKKRIKTENWGDIKISRKKIPFSLPDELVRLTSFLESATDQKVKIIAYDSPSFKDLIKEASEGMGADDAAMEMLLERGSKSKRQLVAALRQKQFKNYRHIVVRFLLTMYLEDSIYEIVKNFIDELPDGEEKNEFLALFVAFSSSKENVE